MSPGGEVALLLAQALHGGLGVGGGLGLGGELVGEELVAERGGEREGVAALLGEGLDLGTSPLLTPPNS